MGINVHLGTVFDEFVAGLLKTGHYQTQSEVLREGLRLLKEREEVKQLRLAELRKEIAVGSEQADRGQFVDRRPSPKSVGATLAPHDLRRSCARFCHTAGGELDQIQFLLGHVSIETTERYLGCKQRIKAAVNDRPGIEPPV